MFFGIVGRRAAPCSTFIRPFREAAAPRPLWSFGKSIPLSSAVMRQPCVEASPECVKGVLDGLGVPEYGYRLLGIVHDDKPALHARFSAFRPFFVFRLGQTYILLVSCDICQPVDVPSRV